MIIKTIVNGMLQENCYVIMDKESKELAIIDPGSEGERLEKAILSLGGIPKYILLTHGHDDHVSATEYLADKFNIPFYINKADEEYMGRDYVFGKIRRADGYLSQGHILNLGTMKIKVIETPGHTKGGLCFLVSDKLFSGDTLFQGSIGRSDFIGGNFNELITSIKTKLLNIGDNVEVYPGHGPSSTIEFEKKRNPYLVDGFDIF